MKCLADRYSRTMLEDAQLMLRESRRDQLAGRACPSLGMCRRRLLGPSGSQPVQLIVSSMISQLSLCTL